MKVPAFLKNKYVLYFLVLIAIVNVLGYISLEKYNSMALFVVMILLSRYFSKNTAINILIALCVTSIVTLNELFKKDSKKRKMVKERRRKKKEEEKKRRRKKKERKRRKKKTEKKQKGRQWK